MKIYPFKLNGNGKYDRKPTGYFESWAGQIYLHGKLAEDNGYDLCAMKYLPKQEGIYNVEVLMDNGTKKAKLFFWQVESKIRGLVVEINDNEHMRDAKKKFERRAEYI